MTVLELHNSEYSDRIYIIDELSAEFAIRAILKQFKIKVGFNLKEALK